MSYSWPDFIGNVGVFLILLSYFLLQLEKIDPKSLGYSVMNGLGALLICFSLYFDFNLSAFIIESCWFAISLFGLYRAMANPSTNEAN